MGRHFTFGFIRLNRKPQTLSIGQPGEVQSIEISADGTARDANTDNTVLLWTIGKTALQDPTTIIRRVPSQRRRFCREGRLDCDKQ